MRGCLFTILAAASAMLCVGALALWVRSYWRYDIVSRTSDLRSDVGDEEERRMFIRSNRGIFALIGTAIATGRGPTAPDRPLTVRWARLSDVAEPAWDLRQTSVLRPPFGRNVAGFAYGREAGAKVAIGGSWYQQRQRIYSVPHWFAALVLAIPPALWFWRRLRRPAPGTCLSCGYDLRATPGRCPECGAIPEKSA